MVGLGLVLCINTTVLCLSSACLRICICAMMEDLLPAVGLDVPTSLLYILDKAETVYFYFLLN